jgi:hypothetical protein
MDLAGEACGAGAAGPSQVPSPSRQERRPSFLRAQAKDKFARLVLRSHTSYRAAGSPLSRSGRRSHRNRQCSARSCPRSLKICRGTRFIELIAVNRHRCIQPHIRGLLAFRSRCTRRQICGAAARCSWDLHKPAKHHVAKRVRHGSTQSLCRPPAPQTHFGHDGRQAQPSPVLRQLRRAPRASNRRPRSQHAHR